MRLKSLRELEGDHAHRQSFLLSGQYFRIDASMATKQSRQVDLLERLRTYQRGSRSSDGVDEPTFPAPKGDKRDIDGLVGAGLFLCLRRCPRLTTAPMSSFWGPCPEIELTGDRKAPI